MWEGRFGVWRCDGRELEETSPTVRVDAGFVEIEDRLTDDAGIRTRFSPSRRVVWAPSVSLPCGPSCWGRSGVLPGPLFSNSDRTSLQISSSLVHSLPWRLHTVMQKQNLPMNKLTYRPKREKTCSSLSKNYHYNSWEKNIFLSKKTELREIIGVRSDLRIKNHTSCWAFH